MINEIKAILAMRDASRMSAEELRKLQEQKLRRIIRYAFDRVPFYRERLQTAGANPQDIRTLEDLQHLPICLEIGRIAAQCALREGLHVNTDHVVLESWCGNRPAAEGENGLAVVTSLNARTMPFIRYEVGDRIVPIAKSCPCGSRLPLIGPPWGRADDVMVLPSGRKLPPLRCSLVLRKHLSILRFQITQKKIGR